MKNKETKSAGSPVAFIVTAVLFLALGVILGRTAFSDGRPAADAHAGHDHADYAETEHADACAEGDGCGMEETAAQIEEAEHVCAEGDACGMMETAAQDHEEDEHAGHAHAAADLDELEHRTCEHAVAIVECDECRYEVGVVKIEPALADSLIETAAVEEVERRDVLTFTGQVDVDRTRAIDVLPPGGGRVKQVLGLLGQRVEAGDVLAVIHSPDFGQAKADFLEVQAQLELAKSTFEREKKLYQDKVSSQSEYLDAQNGLKAAQAAYAAAQKRLALFGLSDDEMTLIDQEQQNGGFADLPLRAPQAGTIIAQAVSAGRLVDTTAVLYSIADLSNLWVWCDVYEKDLAALHEALASGQSLPATVRVRAFESAEFAGAVDLVGSVMDERTRTVKMRIQAANADSRLRPGMFASVEVALPRAGRMAVVPRHAVMTDEGRRFVFQHWKNDLWVRRDVTVGAVIGDRAQILDGLPAGATVITGGAFMLKSDILREKMGAGCAH